MEDQGALRDPGPRAGRRSRRSAERLLPQDPGTPDRHRLPHRGRRQTLDRRALRAEGPPRRQARPNSAALAEITPPDSCRGGFETRPYSTVRTVSPTAGVWILWFGASLKARSLIRRLEPCMRMIWRGLNFSVMPSNSSWVQCAAKLTR